MEGDLGHLRGLAGSNVRSADVDETRRATGVDFARMRAKSSWSEFDGCLDFDWGCQVREGWWKVSEVNAVWRAGLGER